MDSSRPISANAQAVALPDAKDFHELYLLVVQVCEHLGAMTGEWWRSYSNLPPLAPGVNDGDLGGIFADQYRRRATQEYRDQLRNQLLRLWHSGVPILPEQEVDAEADIRNKLTPWLMNVLSADAATSPAQTNCGEGNGGAGSGRPAPKGEIMADKSLAATRLGPLLAKIRDQLRESIDFLCGRRQTLGPFTAHPPAGNNLPIILLDKADIATAKLYLLNFDLEPDAVRFDAMAKGCRVQSGQQSLGITAEGLSEEERDRWTELFGPLPDSGNPDDVANRRTMLIGRCSRFLEYVEELIGTVDAMLPPADDPIECLVTLQQVAPLIHRQKRTLERYLRSMPLPTVQGSGGKASLWRWSELGPWLEKQFEIPMPKKFTADSTRILTDGLADDLADKVAAKLTDTNTQPHATTDIPKID